MGGYHNSTLTLTQTNFSLLFFEVGHRHKPDNPLPFFFFFFLQEKQQ